MTTEKLAEIRERLGHTHVVWSSATPHPPNRRVNTNWWADACSDLLAEVDRLTVENARLKEALRDIVALDDYAAGSTACMMRNAAATALQHPPEPPCAPSPAPNAREAATVPERDADAIGGEG